MSSTELGIENIKHWIECYGSQVEHWPAEKRASLDALLKHSPELAQCLEEARRLDDLLEELPGITAPAALQARVAEIPIRHPRPSIRWYWPFETLWRPALALTAAAVLGVVAGLQFPFGAGSWAATDEAETSSEDWGDMSSVAFAAYLGSEEEP